MHKCVDEGTNKQTKGMTDGWMDGWMHGRMNECYLPEGFQPMPSHQQLLHLVGSFLQIPKTWLGLQHF